MCSPLCFQYIFKLRQKYIWYYSLYSSFCILHSTEYYPDCGASTTVKYEHLVKQTVSFTAVTLAVPIEVYLYSVKYFDSKVAICEDDLSCEAINCDVQL